MRRLTWIVCAVLLVSAGASATPVTIGSLSSNDDGSTTVITDSLNQREWLRWNVLLGKNYAQTLAAIADPGSAAYGFQVAHNADAQLFVNALLGPANNQCTGSGNTSCWGNGPFVSASSFSALWGDNYIVGNDFSAVFFLSDNGTGQDVGLIEPHGWGDIYKGNEWAGFSEADNHAVAGYQQGSVGITWLLYRQVPTTVPDGGATLGLLGAALLGVSALRRRVS